MQKFTLRQTIFANVIGTRIKGFEEFSRYRPHFQSLIKPFFGAANISEPSIP